MAVKDERVRAAFDAVCPDEAAYARMWAAIESAYDAQALQAQAAGAGEVGARAACEVGARAGEIKLVPEVVPGARRRGRVRQWLPAAAAVFVLAVGAYASMVLGQSKYLANETAAPESQRELVTLVPQFQADEDGFVVAGGDAQTNDMFALTAPNSRAGAKLCAAQSVLVRVEHGFTVEELFDLCDKYSLELDYSYATADGESYSLVPSEDLSPEELDQLRAALAEEPGVLCVE